MTALLGIARGEAVDAVAAGVGVGRSTVYAWLAAFLREGAAGRRVQWKGGRPKKLTPTQRRPRAEIGKAGPEAAGCPTGCWHALLSQPGIRREFGVTDNVHDVATVLHHLGFSFQPARVVADHLDAVPRAAWRASTGPAWRQQALAAGGRLLCGDAASFAHWGSLGSTGAPAGQQPVVQTTGRRTASAVFGRIEFCSGRRFSQGRDGTFNGQSDIAFPAWVLEQTTEPRFLVQDGASYHRAAPVKACFEQHRDRLHVTQLPSYAPDYQPIEFLWQATQRRATQRRATQHRSFPEFDLLIGAVEEALAYVAPHPERVKALFGRYLDHLAEVPEATAPVAA